MACASPAYVGATYWFLFVAVTAFIASLIWTFIYLLSIREALKLPINWLLTELLNTALEAALYLTAFVAQLSFWVGHGSAFRSAANIAAGIFGIFNTFAYAAGAYFIYLVWKNSSNH
ncbi:uncharacterized protein LOC105702743 [Orussus abietinus]|uniref:uncharacterized protein LOC105702743 n=1 Tax=Orussus abietinus TaxID=222816 RepID=UPI000C716069|nr:uncharacterized protein LOC105702743 [Orussus abietinus]